jgi:predicted DNA-binding transcriptional regulator YafY
LWQYYFGDIMTSEEKIKYTQARNTIQAYLFIAANGAVTLNEIGNSLYPNLSDTERKSKNRSIQRVADILVCEGVVDKEIRTRNIGNLYKVTDKMAVANKPFAKLTGGETLAFAFLQSFMDSFSGTTMGEHFAKIKKKIEANASDEFIPNKALIHMQMPGLYEFDLKREILARLLVKINEETWITFDYIKKFRDEKKTYDVLPTSLAFYEGMIYLMAYSQEAKKHLTFAVYNIIDFEDSSNQNRTAPTADTEIFKKERFAIFNGDLVQVKLTIIKEMVHYFENRQWHPTQKLSNDAEGNLILSFKAPLAPDMIGWIKRWSDAIIDIQPKELKSQVVKSLKEALKRLG